MATDCSTTDSITFFIGKIPFECIPKEELGISQEDAIKKIIEGRDKAPSLWYYLIEIITNVDILDTIENRNSMIEMFKFPKLYKHAICMFMIYSQIDFLRINIQLYESLINNKESSSEIIRMCKNFIVLIKHKLKSQSEFDRFKEACGDDFEMVDEIRGIFKILNCADRASLDKKYYKKMGFNYIAEFKPFRNTLFSIYNHHHRNNDFIYCQITNKDIMETKTSKKRKRE